MQNVGESWTKRTT